MSPESHTLLLELRRRKAEKEARRQRDAKKFRIFIYLLFGLVCALGISLAALVNQNATRPEPQTASTVR